jgi:hypothetical protein
MPANDKPIKVIKREQRETLAAQTEDLSVAPQKTDSEARREILKTITLWIEEQKETQKALSLAQVWPLRKTS